MDSLREMLDLVSRGKINVDDALAKLEKDGADRHVRQAEVVDLGFAHVDINRKSRCGFPEVIFCQGKTPEWVEGVVHKLIEAGQDCLGTRVSDEQAERLGKSFPEADQDRVARTFWLPVKEPPRLRGKVVVLTAGTSDLPVAREAVVTARALGCDTMLRVDVGVAGIHRLLRYHEEFAEAEVVIVVAGMDGALPSVVGGLVACPVIAVPTSVGYGTAFSGLAPLLTMLNTCSANVVTVNIDNGFKAGYVAALIVQRLHAGDTSR